MAELILITPPEVEPVTLAQAKAHLRLGHDAHDDMIAAQVAAAREAVEAELRRTLITTTWEHRDDAFPGTACADSGPILSPLDAAGPDRDDAIRLPRPRLLGVLEVSYVDADGDLQTLDPSAYQVCGVGGRGQGYLVPAHGTSWPATRDVPEAIRVQFVAGYGPDPDDVPAAVRIACKLWLGHLYEHAEATVDERASFVLPMGVQCLLAGEHWGEYP